MSRQLELQLKNLASIDDTLVIAVERLKNEGMTETGE